MPTLELSLDETIYTALSVTAQQRNQSLEEVIEAALTAFLPISTSISVKPKAIVPTVIGAARRAKIHAEAEAWQSMPAGDRQKYRDVFVAIHESQVIDYDPDRLTLYRRVRTKVGDTPVLITPGYAPHPREFQILSPRRVR